MVLAATTDIAGSKVALPGYTAFVAALEARLDTTPISLGLIDIDWFGKLNKHHSREVGNALLAALSDRLFALTKDSGMLFRYGGDAFVVMLTGVDKEAAFLMLEAWRTQVAAPFSIAYGGKELEIKLTISAGVAAAPDDASDITLLLRKCNEALYRAKTRGRDRVCLAREEKMVTKTTHYTQGQLEGLSRLAKREGLNEAVLLREAMDDLLRKYNS